MKPVISWVKAHIAIVVCCALILVAIPAGFVVSSSWNASIKRSQETRAADPLKRIESARVNYTIPAVLPGQQAVDIQTEPTRVKTEWFKAQRERLAAEAARLVESAEEFNRRGHGVLVADLFPRAASGPEEQRRTIEMAQRLVGVTGAPSVYETLLKEHGAGEPADPQRLQAELNDLREREVERMKGATPQRQLTPEESDELAKRLVDARLAATQRHAATLSFYASTDALPLAASSTQGPGGRAPAGAGSTIPTAVPTQPPSIEQAFQWQADFWLIQDVVRALADANTSSGGERLSVDRAPVKRLESLQMLDAPYLPAAADPMGGGFDAAGGGAAPASVTGRTPNDNFDVRRVRLRLVVSGEQLPRVIDALTRSDFMAITDLDLTAADPWDELEAGYYFGPGSVMTADIELETVWLRSWMRPLMPNGVRTRLNIPLDEPAPGDAAAGGGGSGGGSGGGGSGGGDAPRPRPRDRDR